MFARGDWRFVITFGAAIFVCLSTALSGCSLPNLENPECSHARDSVKQFYSWYLGTDADERGKHPEIFNKFISPEFPRDRSSALKTDPVLLTDNFPKTFRVGVCKMVDSEHVELQVLLLWRDDIKSEQKEIKVEAVKTGDKWLIKKVFN